MALQVIASVRQHAHRGMSTTSRYLLAAPLAACLLFTAYNGIVEGYRATHYAGTPGMKVATAFQLAYGVLGTVGLYVLVRRPDWSRLALLGWSGAVVAEGLLAPIVYAGKGVAFGIGVAVAVAAFVGVMCWGWAKAWLPSRISERAA